MKKISVFSGMLLAGTLVLTGCSSAPAESENDAAATAEIDPQATLAIGTAVLQSSWDVARTVGSLEVPLLKLVYDGLTNLDVDNNVVEGLATSWSTPDEGVTWDFELREGISFSSGDTFDADDAVATLQRYTTLEGSTLRGQLANVATIEAVSPTTLRVVQKQADVTLPILFSDRPGIMMSADELAGDITQPIGTGPFVFASEEPGVSFSATANDNYWQPEYVKVAGVEIRRIEDAVARSNALRAGDIDMAIVPAQQLADIQSVPSLKNYPITGREIGGITFNPDLLPALADERVRDALNMAIDREGLVMGPLLTQGAEATQFRMPGSPGYSDAAGTYKYDPEAAKKLLAEAGFAEGLTFEATTLPKLQKVAEAVQGFWAEIGVDMKVVVTPPQANAEVLWYAPAFPVGFWSFDGAADVTLAYQRTMAPTGPYNPGKIDDPRTTELIAESASTVDPEKRQLVLDELAEIMATQTLGNTPLVFTFQNVGYSDDLVGMQEWQAGFPIVEGLGKISK